MRQQGHSPWMRCWKNPAWFTLCSMLYFWPIYLYLQNCVYYDLHHPCLLWMIEIPQTITTEKLW